jgi:hypothetical protein
MPDIYQDLLARAIATYRVANNGFHPDANAKQIAAALDGLNEPLGTFAAAIAKQKTGGFPNADAFATATRDALRVIDAQRDTLNAAMTSAAAADRTKVTTGATLDVQANLQKAKVQQAADAALLASVDDIIRHARSDAAAAAGGTSGDDGDSRGAMTVGQWIADEIADISGAESEEDGP